jgi:hypothetical protein
MTTHPIRTGMIEEITKLRTDKYEKKYVRGLSFKNKKYVVQIN